jgi:hypothetical protein
MEYKVRVVTQNLPVNYRAARRFVGGPNKRAHSVVNSVSNLQHDRGASRIARHTKEILIKAVFSNLMCLEVQIGIVNSQCFVGVLGLYRHTSTKAIDPGL